MKRRTLVDLIAADMARDPLDAPVVDVQDAVLAQDMEWLLAANDRAEQHPAATDQRRQYAEHADQGQDDDEGVAGDAAGSGWLLSHGAEFGPGPA